MAAGEINISNALPSVINAQDGQSNLQQGIDQTPESIDDTSTEVMPTVVALDQVEQSSSDDLITADNSNSQILIGVIIAFIAVCLIILIVTTIYKAKSQRESSR
jgi:hypothetical protein